jgi:hypothetical protein
MYGFRSNAKNDIGPSDVHLRGFLCVVEMSTDE